MTHPLDVVSTGLARMESYLDRCAEIVHDLQLGGTVPVTGDSLERKVHALIPDIQEGVSNDKSIAWLGQAILGTKALISCLAAHPESADQEIESFLNAWGADTEATAWAGKNTAERLDQLIGLVCAGLEGFCGGLRDEGNHPKLGVQRHHGNASGMNPLKLAFRHKDRGDQEEAAEETVGMATPEIAL